MATYQDNAELMNGIYKYGTLDEQGNDVTNNISYEDINKKPVTWTKVEVAGRYMEINNTATGYYGAVYTNGNGEYIIVNRGTNNIQNKISDGSMALGNIPDEFYDAYALAKQASSYIDSHGGGSLAMTGHSAGGTYSVLQGIIFGGEVDAFNPYNSKNFLDKVERVDTSGMEQRKIELQNQINNGTGLDGITQSALDMLNQELVRADATNALYDAWHNTAGSNAQITNFVIEHDPVSGTGAIQNDQLGETVTITYDAKGDAKLMGVNEYVGMLDMLNIGIFIEKLGEAAVDFFADVDTFHGANNFLLENLTSSSGNLQIKSSKASNSDALLELAAFFKDKNNFEIDQTGAGSIKIGKEHELYVGFGKNWVSSSDDRSQLITSVHDSIYSNAGYKSSGSLSQVQMMIERIQAQFANSKYFYVKSVESPDLQTYMLIAPKDPTIDPNTNNYLTNAENWRPPRDPLAVDLDGDGIETISQNAGIVFDTDADGLKTGTSWLKGDDGWLVIDKNNNGKIDNGSELFGDAYVKQDQTKAKDAYDALGDIDSNHDGMITAADAKFAELKIWQDKNQNGISEANELKTLSEIGLVELKAGRTSSTATNLGNGVTTNGGSTTVINGVDQQTGALNLSQNTFYREFINKLDTSSVADLPELVGSGMVRDLREAMTLSTKLTQDVRTYMSSNVTERSKMLDELASDWAATSMLSTSKNRHAEAHTDFYFGGVDSSINPNAQSDMLDKLAIVEAFNGRRINAGSETQTVIYQRDVYGNVLRDVNGSPLVSYVHTNVSFSDAQTSWILQSYNSITNSIDKGLSVYTDVFSQVSNLDMVLDSQGNVSLDLTKLYASLENKIAANPEMGMHTAFETYAYMKEAFATTLTESQKFEFMTWTADHSIANNVDLRKYWTDISGVYSGTAGNDQANGTSGKDYMHGLTGDDIINSLNGNDIIFAEDGNDVIYGGDGDDILSGGTGEDRLDGGNGNDVIYGEDGNDALYGVDGADRLDGGAGDDYIEARADGGGDILIGGSGNDTIVSNGNPGVTTYIGGTGNDSISSYHSGNDTYVYNLGDGNDVLLDKGGSDTLRFGAGIVKEDLSFENGSSYTIIKIGVSGSIRLNNTNDARAWLETFEFADGSKINNVREYVYSQFGSNGNDIIYSSDGGAKIEAKDGNDVMYGIWTGSDEFYGGNGNDALYGVDGADRLDGGAGDDYIEARADGGGDILIGGSGNDTIVSNGNPGVTTYIGGTGDDSISSYHGGNDTYVYNLGDGNDTLQDRGGTDTLRLGAGISKEDLSFENGSSYTVIKIANSGNIKLNNTSDARYWLETIEFADGSKISNVREYVYSQLGSNGNDIIYSSDGGAKIEAKDGNDVIYGIWTGRDEFYGGDGNDALYGVDGADRLDGGAGDDYIEARADGGGDILIGGSGNDTIVSNGNPGVTTYIGGTGNDSISSYHSGNDTYVYNLGDGNDVLLDKGGSDTLRFGAGIVKEDLSFENGSSYTIIKIGISGSIRLNNTNDARGWLETFEFADGSKISNVKDYVYSQLGSNGNDIIYSSDGGAKIEAKDGNDVIYGIWTGRDEFYGGDGNDALYGVDGADRLDGGAGDDYIEARADGGGDILIGGSGNDTIVSNGNPGVTTYIGGTGNDSISSYHSGNDTYVYNLGDGNDILLDNGGVDSLRFGIDITKNDLIFSKSGNDLVVNIGLSGTDSITVKDHFVNSNRQIELITFADGSTLSKEEYIKNLSVNLIGTDSADILTSAGGNDSIIANGGNDTITSGAGRDAIDAGSGDDIINAGTGNDIIAGGSGNDTYIYKVGDGQDTIRDIAGTDTLTLQSIQASALKFTQDNNDLLINFTNLSTDAIRVSEWFSSNDNRIEQLKLDDGSILNLNAAVEAQLITKYGTSFDEVLELVGTKTQVIAGTGNDVITDKTSNNTTYIFTKGDGKDTIIESNSSTDTIQLNNVTPQELSYSKVDNDLILNLGGDDQITIKDFTNRTNRIENISFNNGMTLLLAEVLASAKVFGNDKTVTSNTDDNLWLEQGAKINLREGNNQAYINSNGIATTVTSGAGNDNIEVYDNANVTLNLGNGSNNALVKDGNHAITSGTGNDNIILGAGVSNINVGAGDDNVTITKTQTSSSFSVSLGAGNDSLKVNGAGGTIKASNSSGDDTFSLANINTQVSVSGGNNLINLDNSALAGDINTISLAAGDDQITINSSGQTTIRAGEGTNQVNLGGGGTFSVSAGSGDDQVKVQDLANSTLSLGNGNNTILAQDGNHKITTGSGNDSITIGSGVSTISSGDGDDNVTITNSQSLNKYTINLGAGNDSLNFNGNGGELASVTSSSGNDQININNIRSQITLSSGDNTVNLNNSQLSGESNSISTGVGNDMIAVNSNGINTINAGNGTNQITLSGNSSNTVTSGSGNDVIKSNAGSLTLNSGAGDDVLEITSNEAQDKFTLSLGDGNDTVKITATGAATTIANNYGDDSYELTGTQVKLSDTLGNTTLILNNQQLTSDVNTISTGVGNDSINITSNGSNQINAGNGNNQITLSGNSKDNITSGSGDDVILAGAGDDIINAGSGNDIINGGAGNDVLNGSTGNDTYIFNKGDGADIIQDAGGNDVMKLGEGIKKEDLWFKKNNKDLTINNLTNQDQIIVKNWYGGSANKVEQIELADGEHISNISIDQLVQAMATFDVKPMAETSLTPAQQDTIQGALANTWVDPTK